MLNIKVTRVTWSQSVWAIGLDSNQRIYIHWGRRSYTVLLPWNRKK